MCEIQELSQKFWPTEAKNTTENSAKIGKTGKMYVQKNAILDLFLTQILIKNLLYNSRYVCHIILKAQVDSSKTVSSRAI